MHDNVRDETQGRETSKFKDDRYIEFNLLVPERFMTIR
jgi:hypothetical protein